MCAFHQIICLAAHTQPNLTVSVHLQSAAGNTVVIWTVLPGKSMPSPRFCGSSVSTMQLAPWEGPAPSRSSADTPAPLLFKEMVLSFTINQILEYYYYYYIIIIFIIIIFKCSSGKLSLVPPQEAAKSSAEQRGSAWGGCNHSCHFAAIKEYQRKSAKKLSVPECHL